MGMRGDDVNSARASWCLLALVLGVIALAGVAVIRIVVFAVVGVLLALLVLVLLVLHVVVFVLLVLVSVVELDRAGRRRGDVGHNCDGPRGDGPQRDAQHHSPNDNDIDLHRQTLNT